MWLCPYATVGGRRLASVMATATGIHRTGQGASGSALPPWGVNSELVEDEGPRSDLEQELPLSRPAGSTEAARPYGEARRTRNGVAAGGHLGQAAESEQGFPGAPTERHCHTPGAADDACSLLHPPANAVKGRPGPRVCRDEILGTPVGAHDLGIVGASPAR